MNDILFGLAKSYLLKRPRKGLKIIKAAALKAKGAVLHRRKTCAPDPTTFIFRITNRCNLRCIHCGQWKVQDRPEERELSTGDWMAFIENNASAISHIAFFGGEPLMRDDLMQIAEYASRKGITSELATNGVLLSKYANEVVRSGIDYISVSIDGPEGVNNSIRQGPASTYRSAMDGIAQVLKARRASHSALPVVEACFTVTPENQRNIIDAFRITGEAGVDVFRLQLSIFTTEDLEKVSCRMYKDEFGLTARYWRAFNRDMSRIDPHAVESQIDELLKVSAVLRRPVLRLIPSTRVNIRDYFHDPAKQLFSIRCAVPWRYLQIMPNGDVSLCMDFPDLVGGNILKEGWKGIWNGERFRKFRAILLKGDKFPGCGRCCTYLSSISDSKTGRMVKSFFYRRRACPD